MDEQTYWNGEPTPCRKVMVMVTDKGTFPQYWARHLVGKVVKAVEVHYHAAPFYIYDAKGEGWNKVTNGRGSPRWGHSDLEVIKDSVYERFDNTSTT